MAQLTPSLSRQLELAYYLAHQAGQFTPFWLAMCIV